MTKWRSIENVWCLWPSRPKGLIEMIGGSYLAASPHISYLKLLEALAKRNLAVHAWSYIPGFDHQSQANQAWKNLRHCKKILKARVVDIPISIRIGHSLGAKLHLLAPDAGRNSDGLISLCFNNYSLQDSIPILKNLAPKLLDQNEFNPSPKETLRFIAESYYQPRNLLISFKDDKLDESSSLLKLLENRQLDSSEILSLDGNHLTPISTGISQNLFKDSAVNHKKAKHINILIDTIYNWI